MLIVIQEIYKYYNDIFNIEYIIRNS